MRKRELKRRLLAVSEHVDEMERIYFAGLERGRQELRAGLAEVRASLAVLDQRVTHQDKARDAAAARLDRLDEHVRKTDGQLARLEGHVLDRNGVAERRLSYLDEHVRLLEAGHDKIEGVLTALDDARMRESGELCPKCGTRHLQGRPCPKVRALGAKETGR